LTRPLGLARLRGGAYRHRVSTTTVGPPTQIQSPAPVPRRHFGRWIVAALVIALVTTGVSYVATYQPLTRGSFGLGPEFENAKLPNSATGAFPYIDGAAILWGFSIVNDGPLPVTVTGVEWAKSVGPLGNVSFQVSKENPVSTGIGPGSSFLMPMHPFTLGHGQQRMIVLRAVLSGCTVPPVGVGRNFVVVNSLIVDYKALGVSHTTRIDDPAPGAGIQIALPGNAVCT
jgi:hypothetical protein